MLYSFQGGADGAHPSSALISLNGKLYGTTPYGGSGCFTGCGTVFEVSSAGQETIVYRFKGQADGAHPYAGLLALNGTLYGTTQNGGGAGCGSGGCGTIFAVNTAGSEHVVYSFQGGTDGSKPEAELVALDGVLYGTTEFGGSTACAQRCGTVFAVTPATGVETVLHRFQGGTDGYHPVAALIFAQGAFYGTTQSGGFVSSPSNYACVYFSPGCGTIFKVTPMGKERIVYPFYWSFSDPNGGATPTAPLIYANGKFYGTTILGGTDGNASMFGPGCGTVFAKRSNRPLTYLHLFQRPNSYSCKAAEPNGLIFENGSLYGTTQDPGTIFKLDLSGTIAFTHSFSGGADGSAPLAGLVAGADGLLYGTTWEGGGKGCYRHLGCGTIFETSP